jgi:hypothetical protein
VVVAVFARELSIRFIGLFSGSRRGGQVETVSITGRATPEIAGLQEKYNTGAADWGAINASGRHPADFEAMPKPDHSLWGGSGP